MQTLIAINEIDSSVESPVIKFGFDRIALYRWSRVVYANPFIAINSNASAVFFLDG